MAVKAGAAVKVEELIAEGLGGAGDGAGVEWFVRGSEERVRSHRRKLEALAEVLEGYRAKLMNTSHQIQHEHDKRKRGLP